jgi:acetyl-CoA carboxylase biotin carboxyl carrier protein
MKAQDIADLKQLVDFLNEHQIAEFDLERGDLKLRLKFNQPEASSDLSALARQLTSVASAAGSQTTSAPVPVEPEAGLHMVKSPMVGTFFASPSPGTAACVSVGDRVAKGQVLGIIEAMKLMNEVEADAAGEIVNCFVSNGQPIEYGQPLFSIRLG